MSREERKNMIEFILKMRNTEDLMFMYMTDEEIEHIYNNTYFILETICE